MDCTRSAKEGPMQKRALAAAPLGVSLAQPYFGLHGHAGVQQMIRVLASGEADTYRQALDHLHIVAGRILGRQQAKAIAARTREILDVALIVTPESVDANRDALARVHLRELGFLKVRSYPDVIGLGHKHEGLARFDTGA